MNVQNNSYKTQEKEKNYEDDFEEYDDDFEDFEETQETKKPTFINVQQKPINTSSKQSSIVQDTAPIKIKSQKEDLHIPTPIQQSNLAQTKEPHPKTFHLNPIIDPQVYLNESEQRLHSNEIQSKQSRRFKVYMFSNHLIQ